MIDSEEEARAFVGARCDPRAMGKLDTLVSMLSVENEHQNLVSAATLRVVWTRHIADSAQLLDHVPRETDGEWLDLGTGAGFPGLVVAAMCPETRVKLVESRTRRIAWLQECVSSLGLTNCAVLGNRLESVETFPAHVISARAFAPLPKLVELSRRFSTSDTYWLLPKGQSAAQEIAALPQNLRRLFHVEQSQTDAEAGIVVGRGLEATKP